MFDSPSNGNPADREALKAQMMQTAEAGRQKYAIETPDPVLLDRPLLPEIERGIFPAWVDDLIDAVAYSTETPRSMAACVAIVALATTCQKKYVVELKPGYIEILCLFILIIMESGNRKSATYDAFFNVICAYERELVGIATQANAAAESKNSIIKCRIDGLKKKLSAGGLKAAEMQHYSDEIRALEGELIEIPALPQLLTDDVTSEELVRLMSQNNDKMTLFADEGGIFETMAGRYSKGIPNFDIYLKSYTGSEVRVNRTSRAPIIMRHPALSMCIFGQREILAGLGNKPGMRGKGLLGRFFYILPKSILGYRSNDTGSIPPHVQAQYNLNIRNMLTREPAKGLLGEHEHILRMSCEGRAIWHAHQQGIEHGMRPDGRFELMTDLAGKLPGQTARLAGLLHCAEHVDASPEAVEISAETVARAVKLSDILTAHAMQAYNLVGTDPRIEDAHRVWGWIERHCDGDAKPVKVRDIYQALKGHFKTMEPLTAALDVLRERFYIFDIPNEAKVGKPSPKVQPNPKATRQGKK